MRTSAQLEQSLTDLGKSAKTNVVKHVFQQNTYNRIANQNLIANTVRKQIILRLCVSLNTENR